MTGLLRIMWFPCLTAGYCGYALASGYCWWALAFALCGPIDVFIEHKLRKIEEESR